MNRFQIALQKREKIIGATASTLAVIMFISLIEIFLSNLRGESVILIQPLATALNGFFWSLYGYGRKDWFIITPNLLGLILGLMTAASVFIAMPQS